ncbi:MULTISPECIES: LysR family transcriptional regulator [Pantoea]|jgi:DNA-binding transcriptional LysR family regulator|uniref:LysR family transcriptional regulator n=1 Tax=Pantoea TaxID=53335 RepID=UPI000EA1D183|nr:MULTISPECIES: LysR family transcriptional regulator [Pantoea]MBZ6384901.1 LysR family transcriptional regulator [Pantoea piersonii]MBZ6400872.1 LysR family transcriptional regulator [Pantoea piersonii]MBZ6407774.1 LysR family transcriptional regulator [Pantoea piersonii]MBZ6426850.1 LysR family transcriptional regulator [Pantoea piersonii]NYB03184.1 LysR family transcriptional regulator [Pantoea piersonii]
MNIELRHLRYFLAVAEELHFGRAAQRLNISQPPLSQQIMQLEQEIAAKLFIRTNRSVQLTPAGQQFLSDARAILQQVEQAVGRAARLERGEEGELRIGFTSSAPFTGLVSDALYQFRQRWPQVHIQMQEINTRQQLVPLHEGQLDLGVMRNTLLPPDLRHQLLLREPLRAVVHWAHPLADAESISISELANEPFVFFDPQGGTALHGEILSLLHRYHIKPYIMQEVGEAMTILGLVATGLGVSILPASFARARLADVVWLPLREEDALSEVWLVWSCEREPSMQMRNMMQLLSPAGEN